MASTFQVNYLKKQKIKGFFFYFFSKYCTVFESLSLCKNGMSLRLHEIMNKDSPVNFKIAKLWTYTKLKLNACTSRRYKK